MEAQLLKSENAGGGPPGGSPVPASSGPPRPLGARGTPPPVVPPPIGASSLPVVSPQATGPPQGGAPMAAPPTGASAGAPLSQARAASQSLAPGAHPLGAAVRPSPPLQQKQQQQQPSQQQQQPQQQQEQQPNKQQQQQPPRGAPNGPQGSGAPSQGPPREGKGNKQPRAPPQGGAPPVKRKRGGAKHSSSSSGSSGGQQQQQRRALPPATSADLGRRGRDRLLLDYAQHFVNTGERPQNFIRDVEPEKRFNAYFKLKELMELKRQVIRARATPAQCIRADLRTFDWGSLPCLFDVILVDPPWAEYAERSVGAQRPTEDLRPWTVADIMALPVERIAETPSFCFLWCGVRHLEEARDVLSKWGFRRCEDICWAKTNKAVGLRRQAQRAVSADTPLMDESSFLHRTTEHCLVGIKGLDGHLIHANLDADVIISEEPRDRFSTEKPAEIYDIIERFCLGRRRLELFGLQRNVRDGWLTIGKAVKETNFNPQLYLSWFEGEAAFPEAQDFVGGRLLGSTEEIESLRPKSPPREIKPQQQQQQQQQ
ncbi:hypothetical protein Esti_002601 [Eimeria stiedai]